MVKDIVTILLAFFRQELKLGTDLPPATDIRAKLGMSDADWTAFADGINRYPPIQAARLSISRVQMSNARSVVDIAAVMFAGSGEKPGPTAFPSGRGRREAAGEGRSEQRTEFRELGKVGSLGNLSRTNRTKTIVANTAPEAKEAFPTSRDAPQGATAGDEEAEPGRQQTDAGEPPSFFFALENKPTSDRKTVQGNEVLWGEAFDLVFLYSRLTDNAVLVVDGHSLDLVKRGKVALGVEVIPKGLTLAKGGAFRLMEIKDGKMVGEPPRFELTAPKRNDAEPGPAGVYVTFTVKGAAIYAFFLELHLTDKLSDSPARPRTLDLDLAHVTASVNVEPRSARFTIRKRGGPWQVYGSIRDGDDELLPDDTTIINESSLDAVYRDSVAPALRTIADDTAWRFVGDDMKLPAEHDAAARACMQKTMTVGYRLYRRFSEDPVFKKMIEMIEALPDGSRITITTDREVFPWEMFYPLHYIDDDVPANFQPNRFWGNRFLIESLLLPTSQDEKIPARRQQAGPLYVSMGLNRGIDGEPPWAGREPLPVDVQHTFFNNALKGRGRYCDQYDEIVKNIRDADPASVIYFFCHGTAKELKFDNTPRRLTADHLDGGANYPGWPLVFINACDAGDLSPLSFYSFRTEFRKRKAAGLIAPCFPVPTMFAAMFANRFLAAYSERQSVGATLFNIRRELIARNNPLGLWYSLQCPLDLKGPEV